MPLINSSSKEARSENIRREIDAGKDPKQAAAIAYSEQRKARDCLAMERAALDAERLQYEMSRILTFPGPELDALTRTK
jgi:hypothetical protein